jgi:hypothetical protein
MEDFVHSLQVCGYVTVENEDMIFNPTTVSTQIAVTSLTVLIPMAP